MPHFRVTGTVEYEWVGVVEAGTEDEAEQWARDYVADGDWFDSYGPPDIIDVNDVREVRPVPPAVDAVDPSDGSTGTPSTRE